MIMTTPAACMVPSEQLVDQMAHALEHRGAGSTSGNRTQGKSHED